MKSYVFVSAVLGLLLIASTATARDMSVQCNGTVIVTMAVDGADKMTAVKATFSMKTKGKTPTFKLENTFAKPITGSGKESGNLETPWNLEASDPQGLTFKGVLRAIQPTYSDDTKLYMILNLQNNRVAISGPMSCKLK